MTVPKVK